MSTQLTQLADLESPIAAISTAPGTGGIAVVRLSGTGALAVADKVWKGKKLSEVESHTAHLGRVLDSRGETLDHCVATVFRAPHSFTGQDTVEFSVHGSKYIQNEALKTLVGAGARLANPGEFTRRAFANGRLSLTQAEAVADLIATESRAAHRLALSQMKGSFQDEIEQLRQNLLNLVSLLELELDFSEEDVEFADRTQLRQGLTQIVEHITKLGDSFDTGNVIKNGIPIAIVGPTNAGKSSLLNALLNEDRAIVTEHEGTTRDTIEETAHISDYLFRFIDTAGLRHTDDPVERLGIDRSHRAAEKAHIIVSVIDAVNPTPGIAEAHKIHTALKPHQTHIIALNKCDLTNPAPDTASEEQPGAPTYPPHGAHTSSQHGSSTPQMKINVTNPQPGETISLSDAPHSTTRQGAPTTHLHGGQAALLSEIQADRMVPVSAKNGEGIDTLMQLFSKIIDSQTRPNEIIVTNSRHAAALRQALSSANEMLRALDNNLPTDIAALEARSVLDALSEITGKITNTDILSNIFSKFCIGK